MNYFRPATESDFQGCDVQFDLHRTMSEDIKRLIEAGNVKDAIIQFRNQTGLGLAECKGYVMKYQTFLTAKKDFEDGKPVFVSY